MKNKKIKVNLSKSLLMEYMYHYTTQKNWERIQASGQLRPVRSIAMGSRIGGDYFSAATRIAYEPAVFGLDTPKPPKWLSYETPYFSRGAACDILTCLLYIRSSHAREPLVLLKIRLLPEDNVQVGDYKQIAGRNTKTFDGKKEAMEGYCGSMTSLKDHFNAASADKRIPEFLCFNDIPLERISCVREIPLKSLEDVIAYVHEDGPEAAAAVTAEDRFFQATRAIRPMR